MTQFVIKLQVTERAGYLSAKCPDVPGLHLVDATREGLRKRAIAAIPRLMEVNRHLHVTRVAPMDDLAELRITVS